MPKYLITYDLVGTEETSEDYKRLIEEIKSYADHVKVQKSVWLVDTALSASEIFDYLKDYADSSDRLFVIRINPSDRKSRKSICGVDDLKLFFSS
jgi:hypothetical protein